FSSRRRHTSFSRDWSSDVCSSDLVLLEVLQRLFCRIEPPNAVMQLLPQLFDLFVGAARLESVTAGAGTPTEDEQAVPGAVPIQQIGRASCRERESIAEVSV